VTQHWHIQCGYNVSVSIVSLHVADQNGKCSNILAGIEKFLVYDHHPLSPDSKTVCFAGIIAIANLHQPTFCLSFCVLQPNETIQTFFGCQNTEGSEIRPEMLKALNWGVLWLTRACQVAWCSGRALKDHPSLPNKGEEIWH